MSDDPRDDVPRCTAKAKGTGERCKRRPVPGANVCVKHGGGAPQVQAAAESRVVEAAAEDQIRKLWPGLAGIDPVRDPVDLLARTAAALEHMTDVVGESVNALANVEGGTDMTQLRAKVVLLDRLLDKLLKASDAMARLGIEEQYVKLEQKRADVIVAAFMAALGSVQLIPADREAMLTAYLTGLEDVVPGEVLQVEGRGGSS